MDRNAPVAVKHGLQVFRLVWPAVVASLVLNGAAYIGPTSALAIQDRNRCFDNTRAYSLLWRVSWSVSIHRSVLVPRYATVTY